MKCQVCGWSGDETPCPKCGEASFEEMPMAEAPKKKGRKAKSDAPEADDK